MGKYGTCKKDANGHTKCLDFSDGRKKWKYCRKSAWGKVTCTDRDHSDWWAEEDATEDWGRAKWDAETMTYKGRQCQMKAGKIRCPDSDSRRMDFCGYNQTGKFSCSDWDKGFTPEAPAQPEGTFRMGKYGQCKKDANGHTKCLDFSDGYKRWKYCRKSAWGKVTCSDRDHSDWWAEEDATEDWGRAKWDAETMTYKGRQCQMKADKIRCPDSDSRRMDFCGYN